MVTLIIGKKGSGKTKKLIDLVNEAVERSNGNVVCIEKGLKLTYDINHNARLIDTEHYCVEGYDAFYGFVSGICAGNYDTTDILIDSTLTIGGRNMDEFANFVLKLDKLTAASDVKIVLSVSADESELPAEIQEKVTKI